MARRVTDLHDIYHEVLLGVGVCFPSRLELGFRSRAQTEAQLHVSKLELDVK